MDLARSTASTMGLNQRVALYAVGVKAIMIAVATVCVVFGVGLVLFGWIVEGVPTNPGDWVACINTHAVAAGSAAFLVIALRLRAED
jgi:hypothetical protein